MKTVFSSFFLFFFFLSLGGAQSYPENPYSHPENQENYRKWVEMTRMQEEKGLKHAREKKGGYAEPEEQKRAHQNFIEQQKYLRQYTNEFERKKKEFRNQRFCQIVLCGKEQMAQTSQAVSK